MGYYGEPLKVTSDKKITLKKSDLFVEKDVESESGSKLCYLIFCYEDIRMRYNLSVDDVNILLYLKELWLFNLQLEVHGRFIRLGRYLENEYIAEDYTYKNKKLYKLTDKARNIIKEFDDGILNSNIHFSRNRQVDMDLKSTLKSVLSDIYKKD